MDDFQWEDTLSFPFDSYRILTERNKIIQTLSPRATVAKKIAILGGSTTSEIKEVLELFLLKKGIRSSFFESPYNQIVTTIMFDSQELQDFEPDLVYLHMTSHNIPSWPNLNDDTTTSRLQATEYVSEIKTLWQQLKAKLGCPIVQTNFEYPALRPLGNLERLATQGKVHYIDQLNQLLHQAIDTTQSVHLLDTHYLSARVGLDLWHDSALWYRAKYSQSFDAIAYLAHELACVCSGIFGHSSKALVCDLDNTMWGGVIGDDGLEQIQISPETAVGEAYTDIQNYIKALRDRGVILAVASKNDDATARIGFQHPDSVLKESDFASFRANWQDKWTNLQSIAKDINIGESSLVFFDDNPMERDMVRSQLPEVTVANIGDDPSEFLRILDHNGYFETTTLSKEDIERSSYYQRERQREDHQARFDNFSDYLASLAMKAEILPFKSLYLERITQLINKTNQFNLMTKRMTFDEVAAIAQDVQAVHLYGRLADKFGDHGLVSVITGQIADNTCHLTNWLMSCRVIKRDFETAMFDALVAQCQQKGVAAIKGQYLPTAKNGLVAELYAKLGFSCESADDKGSTWLYNVAQHKTQHHSIEVNN